MAAQQEGTEGRALPDVERTNALGGVHLVAREAEEVDLGQLAGEVEGKLSGGLGGVGVEEDGGIGGLHDAGEVGDGKDDAGLVVGVHDADKERLAGAQGADEGGAVEFAGGEDGDVGDGVAAAFEFAAGLQDGRMLDGGGHDVAAGRIGGRGAEEDGVVGLGGAGGEEDFGGAGGTEEVGDVGAETGQAAGDIGGRVVHAGRVEVAVGEEGPHGLDGLGGDGGGGVVVGVDEHGGAG